jgi:hypothetical protein
MSYAGETESSDREEIIVVSSIVAFCLSSVTL